MTAMLLTAGTPILMMTSMTETLHCQYVEPMDAVPCPGCGGQQHVVRSVENGDLIMCCEDSIIKPN